MRLKLVALVLSFLAFAQLACADSFAIKPTTPVQVSVVPETGVENGRESTFLITASSMLASDALVIDIIAPQGSQWISGPRQWQGSVAPGQVRELRVTLRMPSTGVPTLTANASIQAGDGSRLAANAVYRQQVASPAAVLKTSSGRTVSRNGGRVIEFKIR